VHSFVEMHRPLILRHARALVREHPEKFAAEDVAREIELELGQLAKHHALTEASITSPDRYLRIVAKHALGRAKRRRALIEQLAAGDDLDALSKDIAELDSDLPPLPATPSPEGAKARATLEELKDALPPADALIVALLLEDDMTLDDVAASLAMPLEEVAFARERILHKAAAIGIEADAPREDRRGNP
jgi:DNA-directed RNA polymerase specialized sigma24 family protein